jgi:hypothetical protein
MIDAHLRAPLLLSLLLAACQEPAPVAPTVTVPTASTTASAASSAQAPSPGAQATKSELARLLCAGELPCEIRLDRPAGHDGAGHKLRVVSVYRGADNLGEANEPTAPDAGPSQLGIEETDRVDTISSVLVDGACQRFEYWLVTQDDKGAPRARKLLSVCNEGHGAASVGGDAITIGDNLLTHAANGGSSWRWDGATEISLSPLRLRSATSEGFWTMGSNYENSQWSWDDFSGLVSWYSPPCLADGSAPEPDGPPGSDRKDAHAYTPIPAVDFEGDFAATGWKDTALDRCSSRLDAGAKTGFITHGTIGLAGDASMKVVASKHGELFVEVEDDTWVGPSPSWVKDDHLELWTAKELPGYSAVCLGKDVPAPQQWGIRIADGKVFAGAGKPDEKAISVERSAAPGGAVRLKIKLPKGTVGLSLLYSDSDDGKKQERLFGTSRLVHGKGETLGALKVIDGKSAVCRVEGGKLVPLLKAYEGDTAILDVE